MQAIEGPMEEGRCEDPGESGEWFQLETGLSLTSQESSGARRVLWGLSACGSGADLWNSRSASY